MSQLFSRYLFKTRYSNSQTAIILDNQLFFAKSENQWIFFYQSKLLDEKPFQFHGRLWIPKATQVKLKWVPEWLILTSPNGYCLLSTPKIVAAVSSLNIEFISISPFRPQSFFITSDLKLIWKPSSWRIEAIPAENVENLQGLDLREKEITFKSQMPAHQPHPVRTPCQLQFEQLKCHDLLPRPLYALSYHRQQYVSLRLNKFEVARCPDIQNIHNILVLESSAFITDHEGQLKQFTLHPHSSSTQRGSRLYSLFSNAATLTSGSCLNTLCSFGRSRKDFNTFDLFLHDLRVKLPLLQKQYVLEYDPDIDFEVPLFQISPSASSFASSPAASSFSSSAASSFTSSSTASSSTASSSSSSSAASSFSSSLNAVLLFSATLGSSSRFYLLF